ncbi:MAG TPA: DUF3828 domain-containing protein [Pyrinomonadaceae bacterium]|nr:DUF3828 domain-containing protein [Pyrinomonadaceae bacterium]
MRKVILSLVIISCAAAAASAQEQRGIPPLPKEKLGIPVLSLPETVVKELYRVHRNGAGHVFEKRGRKLQQKFFDERLAALIWKNLTQTPEGEVGNIDFDPLYNAQDVQIRNFRVGASAINGNAATVPVTFTNFDQRVRLVFSLVNTKQGWKVSNINYGGGMDFVRILSQPM